MAIRDDLKGFVEMVRRSTDEGRIPWQEGASDDEFLAGMSGGSLSIIRWRNHDDDSDMYRLSILNAEGKLADTVVSSDWLAGYATLKAILDGARRTARNADDVMRQMMEDLK
ncbi:MAG: hypothetical protein PVJ57_12840 [Phycisphaerae bacterium]|jgi:hypothetical protein